ncbi:MAG: peptidase S45 [Fluviicola sp.]|nr:MAG: peptidase S45 [Fluviicola sp.]
MHFALQIPLILFLLFPIHSSLFAQVDPDNIEIVRDQWGVPHIYGKTDKETAFGLAWAHSEDNFKTIQETFLPAINKLGSHLGKDGATFDYIVQALRCREVAESQFSNLSKGVVLVIEGYLEGINAYAKAHPDEVLIKSSFPMSMMDYLTGYNMVIHFFSDSGEILRDLLGDNVEPNDSLFKENVSDKTIGSNAFMIRKEKTEDNKTYFNINTHQPLEGAFSWYEAHVVSDEGWNMLGSLFPGSPFPLIGTNEHLGWTHTFNYPDLIDVYQLEMHPKKKNVYRFDGEWKTLETSKAKLKVKLFWGMKLSAKKKLYWSVHGPVFKNKSGYFAFHSNAMENISSIDQWYQMNKSTNFEEFKTALKMCVLPRFNVAYADREDNIFIISGGRIPIRTGDYDWAGVLPGNTSKTITSGYHAMEDFPQILNPSHGYLFNTNNSPFNVAHPDDNVKESDYDPTLGYREQANNRSTRFMELIDQYPTINYEEFQRIKYDQQYPDSILCPFQLNEVFDLDPNKYPHIKDLIVLIQSWDRKANIENTAAAQWSILFKKLVARTKEEGLYHATSLPEELLIEEIEGTQKYLLKHFKRIDITLADHQKHTRGDKEVPISGLIDMIAATNSTPIKHGQAKATSGESYIMLIRYSEEEVEIETVLPFGESNHPESPHYQDQMEMYVNHTRKKMTLDKETIYREAVKVYHPREE